ncbi:MAG: RNA polymerase sporulation sigma factor SigG [Eubacteriales bacterium]
MMHPNRSMNKVEICGVNTSKLKTLTDEEKRELLLRSKAGDKEARERLICGNLRLVLSIIQRFTGRRENLDDLFQVGCIGLIKSIDHFNTELDVKFSTYAVPMIIGEVRRYLRDNNAIRVSRSVRDLAYKALQAREQLTRTLQRDPTVEEIAQALGERPAQVAAAMEAIVEPVSLYESVYSDGEDSIYVIDQLKDPEGCDEHWIENISLKEALKKLGDRERNIITMRFYKGKTQMEIAEEIGISQAQVSRLEKSAIEHIRKSF